MFNPFKAIGNFFEALFGKGPWADEYKEVLAFLPKALPVVARVSALVAPGSDLTASAKFLEGLLNRTVTVKDLKTSHSLNNLLLDGAVAIMKGSGLQAKDRILRTAVELANVGFKNKSSN